MRPRDAFLEQTLSPARRGPVYRSMRSGYFAIIAASLALAGCTRSPVTSPQACAPASCVADSCGALDDGCGGTLECGGCEAGLACGVANTCEAPRTLLLEGLGSAVQVDTSSEGVPYVQCERDGDCFAGLGYVHAAHRFYVMDFSRRLYRGRLATLFGAGGVDSDKTVRHYLSTATGEPLEEAMWSNLGVDSQAALQAYASGVNAWIGDLRAGRNGARLSEEYDYRDASGDYFRDDVVDTMPLWTPLDSLAIMGAILQANGDKPQESALVTALSRLPPDLFADLTLPAPAVHSYVRDSTRAFAPQSSLHDVAGLAEYKHALTGRRDFLAGATRATTALHDALSGGWSSHGSNNWAVEGSATSSGFAILANDPHGRLGNPTGVFYAVLDSAEAGGALHVAGGSIPGLPLVLFGHNDSVGWTCTVSFTDATDMYFETISADGQHVSFQGQQIPIIEKPYTIEVAGGAPVEVKHRWVPHHGPLSYEDGTRGLSVRWVGHEAPIDFEAYLDLMYASGVDGALTALTKARATGCNAVIADTAGRVGWKAMVDVPARPWASPSKPPWLPLAGDGSAEWQGSITARHLQQLDPPSGFIASANNALDDGWRDGDPTNGPQPYLQGSFVPGYRHDRIRARLAETAGAHTLEDTLALQSDTTIRSAVETLPIWLAAAPEPAPNAARVIDALRSWKYTCPTGLLGIRTDADDDPHPATAAEAIGCTAYHAMLLTLTSAALYDDYAAFGHESAFSYAAAEPVLYRALIRPDTLRTVATIWDNRSTAAVESFEDIVVVAFDRAERFLVDRFGADTNDWRWGRVHTLTLRPRPDVLDGRLGPFANDGGYISVDPSSFTLGSNGFEQLSGASTRLVTELSPGNIQTWLQLPGGQDMHRDSPHHDNLLADYLTNTPFRLAFLPGEARAASIDRYRFSP